MNQKSEKKYSQPIMVSACLLGIKCTYNCELRGNERVIALAKKRNVIPFCPEQLGGMSTPRTAMNIIEGSGEDVLDGKTKVINDDNIDITKHFIQGAEESLKYATLFKSKIAVMRNKSPSCGVTKIYNRKNIGDKKILVDGRGVTAAKFIRHGIEVYSEENHEVLEQL